MACDFETNMFARLSFVVSRGVNTLRKCFSRSMWTNNSIRVNTLRECFPPARAINRHGRRQRYARGAGRNDDSCQGCEGNRPGFSGTPTCVCYLDSRVGQGKLGQGCIHVFFWGLLASVADTKSRKQSEKRRGIPHISVDTKKWDMNEKVHRASTMAKDLWLWPAVLLVL